MYPEEILEKVREQTKIIGLGLKIRGCYNIQFAIQGNELYVLEVNPRSSRTVPFVAKSSGLPLARIAAKYYYRNSIIKTRNSNKNVWKICVKAPVFPFHQT